LVTDPNTIYSHSTNDAGEDRYDVHTMLVVGSGSFANIGFQTRGKNVKFKIQSKTPAQNHSTQDPYGEVGFYSIKFYYGLIIYRPEWIAAYKTVVPQ